jgi:hypothetical protein
MSDFGFPSLQPLLLWAVAALICALALGAETAVLWRFSQHVPLRTWLRVCAVASLLGALALMVFAQRAWATYYAYPPVNGQSFSPDGVIIRDRELHQILTTYQTVGWVGIGVTLSLLVLGGLLVLARKGGRTDGLTNLGTSTELT